MILSFLVAKTGLMAGMALGAAGAIAAMRVCERNGRDR